MTNLPNSRDNERWRSPYTNADSLLAIDAGVDDRVAFIRKTYLLLAIAVGCFAALSAVFVQVGFGQMVLQFVGGAGNFGMLLYMLGFMAVAWGASRLANSQVSPAVQLLGLGGYVVLQGVFLAPMIFLAAKYGGPGVLMTAALATGGIFAALTATVYFTKADFSFLRTVLVLGGAAAVIAIIASIIFGFSLGIWFSVAMIFLASGYIAYDTSNILHHYNTNQYVAASLALFASVILLFVYILRFLMQRRS